MAESLGNGRYRVSGIRLASTEVEGDSGFGTRIAYAIADKNRTWVFIDGRTYVIDADDDAPARAPHTGDQMALSSPMPATVAAIHVTPGQDVVEGDLLVMLEAMKMELPIRAPRAGRVKSLACRPGERVQPGVPLLELE